MNQITIISYNTFNLNIRCVVIILLAQVGSILVRLQYDRLHPAGGVYHAYPAGVLVSSRLEQQCVLGIDSVENSRVC